MGKTAEITFRKMTANDADAVAEIELKTFSMPWKREDFFRELNKDFAEYIVGEIDEKIVAYAGAWISFNEAEVMNVAVDENFRGQGIGSSFIKFVRENYPQKILRLEAEHENLKAVQTYKNFGFKELPYLEMVFVEEEN